jgi:hypothetical protein
MSPSAAIQSPADPPTASDNPGRAPGLLAEALLLGRDLKSAAHGQLRLAALETRHAGESLVAIIALGLLAAALAIGAWLALMAAGLMVLVERGVLTASAALLLGAVINVVLTLLSMVLIRSRSRALLLSATVDSLRPTPSPTPTQGTPE